MAQKYQDLTEGGMRGSDGSGSSPKGGADGIVPHARTCGGSGSQGPSLLRMLS